MTILEIIQDVCSELSLPRPTSVIGNTDLTITQLLAQAHDDIDQMRRAYDWPELHRTATVTLVTSQANYALPADYAKQVPRTHWDGTNDRELIGPVSAQEWQYLQNSVLGASGLTTYFRVKGIASNQLYLSPTPTSAENGQTRTYEYIAKTCVRPKTWVTGTTFTAGSYCFYNGNIYYTTAGGVSGATAPTHTSGTASDLGISWEYYSEPYTKYRADTDIPLLDNEVHKKGIRWRWLASKSMAHSDVKADHAMMLQQAKTNLTGARTLNLAGNCEDGPRLISLLNVPDSGYG